MAKGVLLTDATIRKENFMSYKTSHPEQDPAEGSREIIDHELAKQSKNVATKGDEKTKGGKRPAKPVQTEHRPM
jgi:hypothetical protein